MKISLAWLGDFVTWREKDPLKVALRLTLSTAEVEEVIRPGALLEHCCVGEILTIAKHPNADKLLLVTVTTDRGNVQVVCGGTNLRLGMKVAFAHVGATVLWHGGERMTLAPVKIRGEESYGMICAAKELGLDSEFPPGPDDGERPIMDLGTRKTGQPLAEALGAGDIILDINNTAITTRPDLWSHIGMARECVALGLGTAAPAKKRPALKFPKTPLPFALKAPAKNSIVRYLGCAIDIASLGDSPPWMKQRLEAVGIRPISLPVDITNYVMLEYGTPLHAFNRDDIVGDIALRMTTKGETMRTLDGVDRSLPEGVLVLSDDAGIFDLVAMMGGKRTSISPTTRRIFLQGPAPDPTLIRRTIQMTGLRSDAATIFEKGVPPVTMEAGFHRAVELFLELAPGARITSQREDWGKNGKAPTIPLSLNRVSSVLGTVISQKEATRILESLGCTVKTSTARSKTDMLTVTPPLWRLRDLTGAHDLIEEIARIRGFDTIEDVRPHGLLQPLNRDSLERKTLQILVEGGFQQILPLSLVGPALLAKARMDPATALSIANPITEDLSLLQPSTLPQLLDHARMNHLLAGGTLRTFHCAHVFRQGAPERAECGLLMLGPSTSLLTDPFLTLLEQVTHLLQSLGHEPHIEREATPSPIAHPGRSAMVQVGSVIVAKVFDVQPAVLTAFDLPGRATAATLDLTALAPLQGRVTRARPLPVFPSITYDVTLTRTHEHPMAPLLAKMRQSSPLLESVTVRDLYEGTRGAYNVTLRCTYRASDRTLTESEATAAHEKLLSTVV